jgi:hypothetical protein
MLLHQSSLIREHCLAAKAAAAANEAIDTLQHQTPGVMQQNCKRKSSHAASMAG